ncbi:MAG: GNAT family N-acetyltransferase [Bacteroidia bacterium]
MKIIRYNSKFKNEWDEFVEKSRNGTFLFKRSFMDYHADRFHDYSLMVYDDCKLIALLPANYHDNKAVSHGGLTYGGLIINADARLRDVTESFYKILEYYSSNSINELLYKQIPYYYHKQHTFEDEYVFFLLNAVLYRRDASFLLELGDGINLQKGKKSNISKAKRMDVVIAQNNDYSLFWDKVLEPNLMKSHNVKPVHTKEEITLLANSFPGNIKLHTASIKGQIVAGTVLFINHETINVQYISANEKGKNIGALDYLFVSLLEYYGNYKYFNFGISNEDEGRYLNQGLALWKEGFGARASSHNFYKIDTANYFLLEKYV